jgi:hypothetical protein
MMPIIRVNRLGNGKESLALCVVYYYSPLYKRY